MPIKSAAQRAAAAAANAAAIAAQDARPRPTFLADVAVALEDKIEAGLQVLEDRGDSSGALRLERLALQMGALVPTPVEFDALVAGAESALIAQSYLVSRVLTQDDVIVIAVSAT